MVTTAADLEVLMAAIATPYDTEGAVDTRLLSTLIGNYVARGVEGIYCCGSSGEGLLLSASGPRLLRPRLAPRRC